MEVETASIRYRKESLEVLDQRLLPLAEKWLQVEGVDHLVELIRGLAIRGAPAIGLVAITMIAKLAREGASELSLKEASEKLRGSRPTAVNLMNYLNELNQIIETSGSMVGEVTSLTQRIIEEDEKLCHSIAYEGVKLIEEGDGILTHCNTGCLATAGVGTALGIIYQAVNEGLDIHVYVGETRPLLQGSRITAWELQKKNIPFTLIVDSCAPYLMRKGLVKKVIVGADRIARNGDFANKIGTYALAVSAKHHNIPFYVAAPTTSVDLDCDSGNKITVEERPAGEILKPAYSSAGGIGSFEGEVYNPGFDVTPVELVTGMVFERGYLSAAQLKGQQLPLFVEG